MSPLRVVVVSDARAVWGSESSVLELAPHLRERGIELEVACPAGGFAAAAAERGIAVRRLDLPQRGRLAEDAGTRPRWVERLGEVAGVPATVRRIARATAGAGLVHSNNLLLHLDCALAGRSARRPTVLEVHDVVPGGLPRATLTLAARLSAATLAVSGAVAAAVPGAPRVRVVPQAVDTDRFRPGPADPAVRRSLIGGLAATPEQPADELVVGVVGRVDPEKGVHRVLHAAARVPGVRVAVVGAPGRDAGYAEQLRATGRELLGPRVHFTGRRDDVPAVLRSLDVLVNASDAEPFGLSVLEAQAAGVPVVAARAGGLPEFVRDGVTGLLVEPGDVAGLAAALEALRDPALRQRLAAAARDHVMAHHGLPARADAVAAVYRAAVAGGAGVGTRRAAVAR